MEHIEKMLSARVNVQNQHNLYVAMP